MKKLIMIVCLCIVMLVPASANTKKTVTFSKCTDGDTAHFLIDGTDTTVRFLAIDTPEYTKEKEPYGKEASAYTCDAISNAKKIELEYDSGSDKTDKYGRHLAWVYVDGKLLQKDLVAQGLAEVAYLYGDYAYTDELKEAQEEAKAKGLNIWSDGSGINEEATPVYVYILSAIGMLVIILLSISNVKGKKSKIRKVKRAMKKIQK